MKPVNNYNISFEEQSVKAKVIVGGRSAITYAQALAPVECLKKSSKVSQLKEKQALRLRKWAQVHSSWITNLPPKWQYLTHGGEAHVYLDAG